MKASERRLVAILAILAAVCGGAILSQSLLRKQRELERRAQALELQQMEATAMLAEADLWKARLDWMRSNQPAMTSDSQATQALLDEMQAAAAKHNLVVQKQQLHEAAHQSFYNEVGATLVMEGDLPDFFRWLHGMLSPESFRMVSLLKITPDAQDKAKIIFTVRLNRRHSTALTAVEESPTKEGGAQ